MAGPPGGRGLRGEPGPPGIDGSIGPRGDEGEKGERGEQGRAHTNVFTVHSFSSSVPTCPEGARLLWAGYSLVSNYNNRGFQQALDNPSSCSPRFSLLATLEDLDGPEAGDGSSSWYRGGQKIGEPRGKGTRDLAKVRSAVARCGVCEIERSLLTVHSESTQVPECPSGWKSLWTGFTYMMASVS